MDKKTNIHNRSEILLNGAKFGVNKLVNATCNVIYDIPDSTKKIIRDEYYRKSYLGPHKSLDDTLLTINAIYENGGQIPYFVLGTNLVRGVSTILMIFLGGIYIDRKEKFKSARVIPEKMKMHWRIGHDTIKWPEDGREKFGVIEKWRNSDAKAAIEYSKYGKIFLMTHNLDGFDVTDMDRMVRKDPDMTIDDYIAIRDDKKKKDEFMKNIKPYTLRAWHLPDWWKDLGNKYVSFGEPIEVKPTDDIQKLSNYAKERSLQLVKILPNNIMAEAIMRTRGIFDERTLLNTIEQIIDELSPHSDKFREFNNGEDIMHKSTLTFHEKPRKYDIFSGYIRHYFLKAA
jgi:hypothetical protein